MDEKKVREAIAKEKETIKTLEDAVVSGKTGDLRRWAKDTIENSTSSGRMGKYRTWSDYLSWYEPNGLWVLSESN